MVRAAVFISMALVMFLVGGAAAKTAYPIELKTVKPRPVLCKMVVTTRANIGRDLGRAYQELGRYLEAQKVAVAGPPLAVYHGPPGAQWRIEACLPSGKALSVSGPFKARKLLGGPVAVLTYRGPYQDMTPVYTALWKWINQKGYKPAGPPREIYVAMPPQVTDPKKFMTLVVWPVKQVGCSPR